MLTKKLSILLLALATAPLYGAPITITSGTVGGRNSDGILAPVFSNLAGPGFSINGLTWMTPPNFTNFGNFNRTSIAFMGATSFMLNGMTYTLNQAAGTYVVFDMAISSSSMASSFDSLCNGTCRSWPNVPFTASGTFSYFVNNQLSFTESISGSGLAAASARLQQSLPTSGFVVVDSDILYTFNDPAAIPEPSTVAQFSIAAAASAILLIRRRRK